MESRRKPDYLVCRHCGEIIHRRLARVSGYDSENSLRHIHCPNCGKILTHCPDGASTSAAFLGITFFFASAVASLILIPVFGVQVVPAGALAAFFGLLVAAKYAREDIVKGTR